MGKNHFVVYTEQEESLKMARLAIDYSPQKDVYRVADLSCGSGNLFLALEEAYPDCSFQFYAYDIDAEALKVLAKRKWKNSMNYYEQDALFLETTEKFDIILGNPPYLGEKNHKDIFEKVRKTSFGEKYYEAKMDYFYFFLEKATELLEEGGIFVYLTTNYWLRAEGAKKLRTHLREGGEFLYVQDYNSSLFEGALGQHNMISVWRKGKKEERTVEIAGKEGSFFLKQEQLYREENKIYLWSNEMREKMESIEHNSNRTLGELLEIKQGIVSGCDEAFIVRDEEEAFAEYQRPFYKNKDIFPYRVEEKEKLWILYLDSKLKTLPKALEKHLLKYRERLEKRREVQRGKIAWWQLQWAREEGMFQKAKIITRQRCKENWFAYSEEEVYGSADLYYLIPKTEEVDLFYLLAFLNSDIFAFWYRNHGKRKGHLMELYAKPLREVPLYYPEEKEEREKISNLAKKQCKEYSESRQKEINHYFWALQRKI